MAKSNGDSPSGIPRALRLLQAFEVTEEPQTLSELSRVMELAPSTTSRLLGILEDAGFVTRGADRRYALGPQVLRLGLLALRRVSLYELALPHLRELARETGESATLGVRAEDRVMYLAHVPSAEPIRHVQWTGATVPLHGTAIGRAIEGDVGDQGHTASRQTIESGVTAIAAPIHGVTGEIIGAISVTGPTFRIADATVARIGALVTARAQELSGQLGHVAAAS